MPDDRIEEICGLIRENLAHNWKIEEMAKMAKMSESHFQKLFKTVTEKTPAAFLREVRLQKARELLEAAREQISQIGRQVGMPHESHFTRNFKTRFGKTPTAYRKDFFEKKYEKTGIGQE